MTLDKQSLKRPDFWAVVVPIILFLWLVFVAFGLADAREESSGRLADMDKVSADMAKIRKIIAEAGGADLSGGSIGDFEGISSARKCAEAAKIKEDRLSRLESMRPRIEKGDRVVYHETYRLDHVNILQVARFIDFAERGFYKVNCAQLFLVKARTKQKDSWDATVDFQYQRK